MALTSGDVCFRICGNFVQIFNGIKQSHAMQECSESSTGVCSFMSLLTLINVRIMFAALASNRCQKSPDWFWGQETHTAARFSANCLSTGCRSSPSQSTRSDTPAIVRRLCSTTPTPTGWWSEDFGDGAGVSGMPSRTRVNFSSSLATAVASRARLCFCVTNKLALRC